MSKNVAAKTWELSVYNGRRYSAGPPIVVNGWPLHEPAYLSVLPGVAGPGMDTPAGTGRHLETPATSVYFINSLENANTGAALTGLGPNVFGGTLEWCRRQVQPRIGDHNSPYTGKVVMSLVGGWAVLQKSIPLQSGTPPRPGYVTEAYHFAPHPGLWLRGAKVSLNGASNVAVWHLRSYMGDDSAGLSAANRDPMGSGYDGGVVTNIAAINCELAWSCDELLDMYYAHDGVSLVNCAFINPLHESSLNPSEDHGFGPMMGGGSQFGVAASFRCLWSNITDRAPFTNATSLTHANNLHFNSGRPGGGAGYAVRIVSQSAAEAEHVNVLGNAFVRGPENNNSIVAVATTATLPAGSQGYLEDNAVHGWTASTQAALLSTSISGFAQSALIEDAYPPEWGEDGVLRWSAQAPMPTEQEWDGYVSLMEATVGAQPGWRMSQFGRVTSVFQAVKDTLAGNMPGPQFSDSVADEGGWFDVPEVGPIDPTDPGAHWWAAFPTSGRDAVLDGSATWGNESWIPEPFRGTGQQLAGRTVLERWIIKQHWYVMDASTRPPLPPDDIPVGPFSGMNLAEQTAYSIDMAEADYVIHYNGDGTGTGTSTHYASGWWDGGAFCRMTPPTVDGLERGIAIPNMWRNATVAMQDVNIRFEWRGSDEMGSLWEGAKWILTHLRNTLEVGNAQDRAIYFAHLANAGGANSRANTILFAPAQGTVQAYGGDGYADSYPPLSPWPDNLQSFYIADDDDIGGGTFNGRPLIPGSEILTFELRVLSVATVEFPNGMIGMRVYRRNGQVLSREVPYRLSNNIDPPSGTLGSYFSEVQQLGCGQYNTAPTPNANLYMDVGGQITVHRDLSGWLGPRAGFVIED